MYSGTTGGLHLNLIKLFSHIFSSVLSFYVNFCWYIELYFCLFSFLNKFSSSIWIMVIFKMWRRQNCSLILIFSSCLKCWHSNRCYCMKSLFSYEIVPYLFPSLHCNCILSNYITIMLSYQISYECVFCLFL